MVAGRNALREGTRYLMGKINPAAITFLTGSGEGPVGIDVQAFAQEVVDNARNNVREILRNYTGNVEEILAAIDYEIVETGGGLEAFIGIRDTGVIAEYLASKEDNEQAWLNPAYEAAKADYQTSIPAFRGAHVSRDVAGRFARLGI